MTEWAAWGTSVGTLALAVSTLAALRSSNRSARVAERALLSGLRPLLVAPRPGDPPEEVQFADGEVRNTHLRDVLFDQRENIIYLAIPLRNAGTGIAHLCGYRLRAESAQSVDSDPLGAARHRRGETAPSLADFSVQQRDLYIAAGDTGFWQAALRDPALPEFAALLDAHRTRGRLTVDIVYGDLEGGQLTVSRFVVLPESETRWRCDTSHHWPGVDGQLADRLFD